MKPFHAAWFVAAAALLFPSPAAGGTPFDATKTRQALPLTTPPTIDGTIAAGEWTQAEGGHGGYWAIGVHATSADGTRGSDLLMGTTPVNNADLSAGVRVGYDASNLYIALLVQDANLFTDDAAPGSANGPTGDDDSVEIFIDGDNSNFGTADDTGTVSDITETGGAFAISANNAYREAAAGNPGFGPGAAWEARAAASGNGYNVEFRISLAAIGNPSPGDVIGFNIVINDDDDGGPVERKLIYTGTPHLESSYANLRIGQRSRYAPHAVTAPTIDGIIAPGEYRGAGPIEIDPSSGHYDLSAGDDDYTPADHSFTALVVHDADAIYVAVRVIDDLIVNDTAAAGSEDGQTWNDDSVEIFFNADNSAIAQFTPGTGPLFDGQYVFTANGARRDNEASNPSFGPASDWFAASAASPGGYTVEFRVSKSALVPIAAGGSIGFNVLINDDDNGGNRESQCGWNGRAHSEFTYGRLTLGTDGGEPSVLAVDPDFSNPDNPSATVTWASHPGQLFFVERSTNLRDWEELTDNVCATGEITSYTDTELPPDSPQAFYRVRN